MHGGKTITGAVAIVALGGLITFAAINRPTAKAANPTAASTQPPQSIDPRWAMRTKGDTTAPVTIFEMSDFLCPWCKLFADSTYPILDRDYIAPGKIQMVFVNLPIPSLHPNAPAGHEFAMCMASQGKFWELHDILFERQEEWSTLPELEPFCMRLADELGASREDLDTCLDSREMQALVAADVNTARRAGVSSTPTFVVRPTYPPGEAVMIPGAVGIDVWQPLLDSMIALKEGG